MGPQFIFLTSIYGERETSILVNIASIQSIEDRGKAGSLIVNHHQNIFVKENFAFIIAELAKQGEKL